MAKTKMQTQTGREMEQNAKLEQVLTETPEQRVERLKRELAEARGQAKKTKTPAVRCAHEGCKLYAMQGREDGMCSNHRPAMEHLSEEEQLALLDLLTEAEKEGTLVQLFVDALGWAKAQVVARERLTTKS